MKYWLLTIVVVLGCWGGVLSVQANEGLPVAAAVELAEGVVPAGTVVTYDEVTDSYQVAANASSLQVYGVTTNRPVITIVSDGATTPVVTQGITPVRVTGTETIERGDLLVTATSGGVAHKAALDDGAVFAVALEAYSPQSGGETVLASVGVESARSWQETRQTMVAEANGEQGTSTPEELSVSVTRIAIAVAIALGAIGFVLFTFRSILTQGMTAIGRNPRARTAVLTMTVGSMVLVVGLAVLILLVAVAVLVLPV
jgi:hypothetical protein